MILINMNTIFLRDFEKVIDKHPDSWNTPCKLPRDSDCGVYLNTKDIHKIDPSLKVIEWKVDNFYKIYKNQIDQINPKDIFNYLDSPYFIIKDKKKFECLINILKSLDIIKNNNFDLFFDFIFRWYSCVCNNCFFIFIKCI